LGVGFHHVPHLVLSSVSEEMTWVRVVLSVNYNHQPVKNFKLSIAMGFEHGKEERGEVRRGKIIHFFASRFLFASQMSFCFP
jgi:hypothetical protein